MWSIYSGAMWSDYPAYAARVDSRQKREALEKAYADVVAHELPIWSNNGNLLSWLKEFK